MSHGVCAYAAYYRGAMGIVVVYDVTDEASFNNIRNWMRNIEQHASETNSNKVCQGSSCRGRCVAWPIVIHDWGSGMATLSPAAQQLSCTTSWM